MSRSKVISKLNLANLEKLGALIAEELVEETSKRLLNIAESLVDFEDDVDIERGRSTFHKRFKRSQGEDEQFVQVMGNVVSNTYLENYGYGLYEDRGTQGAVRIGVVEGKYFMQKAIERLETEIDMIINEKNGDK